MIDDRTTNLNLPKPNALNLLADDVGRLRTALDGIDTAVSGKAAAVHGHVIADVTGLQTALDGKQASLGFTAENAANKGAANGYAGLDGGGKVPAAQLPSYVDDVVEVANYAALPATGEGGKIYVLLTPYTSGGVTSAQFRWTGSAYTPIVSSPGSTDAVPEGSTNLYFTSARALAALPVASASVAGKVKIGSGINVAGDGTISIDGAGQTFEDVLLTAASNGQTAFTATYTVGAIDVYLNGVKLVGDGDDFTATSGTSITLTVGISTTDVLVMRRWSTFLVANAATLGGVETLQNKTLTLGSNTISGTTAQFNTALTDGDFATQAGAETLTNKTLSTGTVLAAAVTGGDFDLTRVFFKDTGWDFNDSGTTNALNYVNGSHQRWAPTAASNPTFSIANWPPSGTTGELLVEAVNLAAAGTVTYPTANWIKSDGTFAASPSAASVTFQSSGTDFILFWTRDGGTTLYAKVVR